MKYATQSPFPIPTAMTYLICRTSSPNSIFHLKEDTFHKFINPFGVDKPPGQQCSAAPLHVISSLSDFYDTSPRQILYSWEIFAENAASQPLTLEGTRPSGFRMFAMARTMRPLVPRRRSCSISLVFPSCRSSLFD